MQFKFFARKFKSLARKIIGRIYQIIFILKYKIYKRSKCPDEVLSRLDEVLTQVTPCKVVIRPWNGRHNVYGIFMIPIEDKSVKRLVVHIPGVGTYCGGAERVGASFAGIEAKPGYYLVKACLRTRTSTGLIVRGYRDQLKDLRNWRLINLKHH